VLVVPDAVLGTVGSPHSVPVLRTMQGEDAAGSARMEDLGQRGDTRAALTYSERFSDSL